MENRDFSNYRILIVDDSAHSRAQMRQILTEHNFTVVGEAASAQEALALVKEKKPHLVLTDIVMPEASGIELAEKIFSNQMGAGVIMLSSLTQDQVVIDAIAAGAADFVAKPIQPLQLVESVMKFLQNLSKE
jgi:YesN/AraC family two-component response regulator